MNIYIEVLICVVLGNIFSRVPIHQGPILTLVYHGYTNIEHIGRKDKINTFVYSRTFNLLYTLVGNLSQG